MSPAISGGSVTTGPRRKSLIVVLICISLMMNDVEQVVSVLIDHSCIFFREMSVQMLCSFLN